MSFATDFIFVPGLERDFTSRKRAFVRRRYHSAKKAKAKVKAGDCDGTTGEVHDSNSGDHEFAGAAEGEWRHFSRQCESFDGSKVDSEGNAKAPGFLYMQDGTATTNQTYDLPPLCLQPPAQHVQNAQAWSLFLQYYLPQARDRSLDIYSWLETLPELIPSSSLAQTTGVALADAFVGELLDRKDLRMKAAEEYGHALALVKGIVAPLSRANQVQPESVLASLLLLAWVETFVMKWTTGDEARRKARTSHLAAAETYLVAHTAAISQTRLGGQMEFVLCEFARIRATAERRPSTMPYHTSGVLHDGDRDVATVALSQIALEIPRLLAITDDTLHCFRSERARDVLRQLSSARSALKQWMSDYGFAAGSEKVPLNDPGASTRSADEPLLYVFMFQSVQLRRQHAIYCKSHTKIRCSAYYHTDARMPGKGRHSSLSMWRYWTSLKATSSSEFTHKPKANLRISSSQQKPWTARPIVSGSIHIATTWTR
jgi:hypothetical protein